MEFILKGFYDLPLHVCSIISYYPFVVFEDWIYATTYLGGDLYKINSKNSEVIKLAEAPVEEFTLYSKGIFYNDGNNLFSINLEGENEQNLMSNIQLKSLTYSEKDNILIFVNSSENDKICSYNINTNELLTVKNGDYSFVQVFGNDEIVTLDSSGVLQSFSLLDGNISIEMAGLENFQIFDHNLYYFDSTKSLYCIADRNQAPIEVYSTAD